ncbi:unnamed protein product [Ilex paraguariensis]|uniref:Uncharacterized protein n=1 Tax=Ilex paraguariensis TaxID=185542 RepID=A0ABC8R9B9_9AQUA
MALLKEEQTPEFWTKCPIFDEVIIKEASLSTPTRSPRRRGKGRGKVTTNFIDLILNPTFEGTLGSGTTLEATPTLKPLVGATFTEPTPIQSSPMELLEEIIVGSNSKQVERQEDEDPTKGCTSINELVWRKHATKKRKGLVSQSIATKEGTQKG